MYKPTDEEIAGRFAGLADAYNRPAIRPDVAELLERHKEEARHFATTPYVPHPRPEVKPSEPIPGWMKGVALMAPASGGGVWLALEGVEGVMNAVSPEVIGALALAGLFVFLVALVGRKRGPKRIVNNYDMRGASVISKRSAGITYKSNN
ncbi:hypothetical protein C9F11_08900 [Streptomyces sp. YIM 121038]|uniref:hypothetical protein n=1 Tax=Streptomyces sp. YIM 121038 TaxID=2136401 RepID=UPI001110A28A|nr:hypothetical protein [Streptomyces sp. YIM 121038]QCX75469.1 hypothetical protein C9F11_08900 [Streptomyces sp. YIM 121038]